MLTSRTCTNCGRGYEYYQVGTIVPPCPVCGYTAVGYKVQWPAPAPKRDTP